MSSGLAKDTIHHSPLRRNYSRIRSNRPKINQQSALWRAVRAMNDSTGREEFVSFLPVFGVLPSLPVVQEPITNQKDRINALYTARSEMANVTAELINAQAIKSKLSPSTHFFFKPSDRV